MKIKIDKITFDFVKTLMEVTRKITPEAVLYWARNPEELAALIDKKDFEPLTQIGTESYLLPATAETDRRILWKRRLISYIHIDNFQEVVQIKQSAQPSCSIIPYKLNAPLTASELIEEIGDMDFIIASAFSYSQIVSAARRHKNMEVSNLPSVLSYTEANYFFIIRNDGALGIVSLFPRTEFNRFKKWEGWFPGITNSYLLKGRLLLKEGLPETILHS
ncbi:MAG: hypothetical protein ABIO57_02490 [Candidatus Paceibacterota bacterium]